MKIKYLLSAALLAGVFAFPAAAAEDGTKENAAETAKPANQLRAHFKRVGLDISSTDVSNADAYKNSPVTQLSADSETVIKGVFDFALEYETPRSYWENSLFMQYGKTKLKPADGPTNSSENTDQILVTSSYTQKMWKYEEADLGPFGSLSYDTEFTDNDDAPRRKIIRGKGGIKLFNGTYTKDLYIAAVGESDLTYAQSVDKLAWEVGGSYDYPLRDGVKFHIEGYFRDYLAYSRYQGTDLKYDLNIVSRMDVKLNNILSLSPFISYRQAQSREANVKGSNLMIGISFAYSDLFDL